MSHKLIREGSVVLLVLVCFFALFSATDVHTDSRTTIKVPLRGVKRSNKTIGKRELPSVPSFHDNLQGRPGQGYYLAVQLGTPPQLVSVKC